jgi:hypothetical protein
MKYFWNILFSCMLLVLLIGCGGSGGGGDNLPAGMHRVQYEVSTSIPDPQVSITYIDENGTTQDLNNIDAFTNNWTHTFIAKSGAHLYLSSALHSEEDGTIRSRIQVDYQWVKESLDYMSGPPAIAEYTIPFD